MVFMRGKLIFANFSQLSDLFKSSPQKSLLPVGVFCPKKRNGGLHLVVNMPQKNQNSQIFANKELPSHKHHTLGYFSAKFEEAMQTTKKVIGTDFFMRKFRLVNLYSKQIYIYISSSPAPRLSARARPAPN